MKYEVKRWNKSRISYMHFGHADFYDFNNFVTQIMENLKVDIRYSILLKVHFVEEGEDKYAMLGKQMGLTYSEEDGMEKLENIHSICKELVNQLWDNYRVDYIKSIQVLYVFINDMPKLELKNVNKVNFNRDFVNAKETRERFNIIPLTVDTNYFGKSIINKDGFLSLLNKINEQRNLLRKGKLEVDENCKMFLYNDNLIIISIPQEDNTYYRGIYESKLGILINEIKDVIIDDNSFVRTIGNVNLTVVDNKIAKVESVKALSPITYKNRSLKDESNPFIGSWDVEAFEVDGYAKVYALGFKVLGKESRMYYMDNGITSDELVLNCIDDMLVNEYNGYTFYTHNFGKYDSVFLMKILKQANIERGYEHYITKELDRGGKMLKLVIKVKRSLSDRKPSKIGARKEPGYNSITIVDSLNILNQSLADLCNSFEVEVTKGHFPYNFVKSNTLHYVGNTPDHSYWEKISLEEYNKLVKPDWSLKDECLKYLDKDLTSLVLIMNKFSEYINRKFYLQVTDSLTISRLALNIFMKDYLKDNKLPIINRNMFGDIKQAYYGGVTEVYKPYGKNLLHYDVNSLYPFAALNPMPGIKCTFIENIHNTIDIKDLFGFFYCEVKTGDSYLGLLPVHCEEGMVMPNGTWKGWYFSEELKYAVENGYSVTVLKGYNFNKVEGVFTSYVKDLYEIKSSTNDRVEKDIAKRLLNHLLGRFGLNITKPITKYVHGDDLGLLFSTREIIGKPIRITDDDYKITYNSTIDPDICIDHGIDYIKVQNLSTKTDVENVNEFKDVSLTTAAAVTSYARIYMSKIKLDILNKGGNIYYTDTDSIVTDIPLDESLVGNELGQFKLEYKIKQGYYISNKTYYVDLAEKLLDKRSNEYISHIIKSKTVDSKSLSLESFIKLYKNQNVEAIKRSSIKDYDKGSVLIVDKTVKVSHDAYTKREKIYKRNKWVDTKPLVLDEDSNSKKKQKLLANGTRLKGIRPKGIMPRVLLNFILGAIFGLLIMILSFTTHTSIEDFDLDYNKNGSKIDLELERLIELKYNDDYMEEPVEIEVYKSYTYLDRFVDFFKQKSSKFYDLFNNHIPLTDKVKQDVSIKFVDLNSVDSTLEVINNERPQVLTSVLKNHIDSLCDEITSIKKNYSVTEVKRLSSEVTVRDAIALCERALRGSPISGVDAPDFENYMSYRTSPSLRLHTSFESTSDLGRDSPILKQVASIGNTPDSVRGSPIVQKATAFETTPSLHLQTSFESTTDLARSSTITRSHNFSSKGHGYSLSGATAVLSPVMKNSAVFSDTNSISPIISTSLKMKQEGLFIDILNLTEKGASTDTSNVSTIANSQDHSVPRKYPIRDMESPSIVKRYGNIWQGRFNVESPSTIKRYGWVSPAGTSVLEDHSPLAKRHGHVFSDNFTLNKDYHVITEHNNVYKTYNSHID